MNEFGNSIQPEGHEDKTIALKVSTLYATLSGVPHLRLVGLHNGPSLSDNPFGRLLGYIEDLVSSCRQEVSMDTLNAMVGARSALLGAHHRATFEHGRRGGSYGYQVIVSSELSNEINADIFEMAMWLHDEGKIGVPTTILNKPTKLTQEEFAIMRTHTNIGAELSGAFLFRILSVPEENRTEEWQRTCNAAEIILGVQKSHHYCWKKKNDSEEDIEGLAVPIEARLAHISDAFDVMTSRRPYNAPISIKAALRQLERESGTAFDPRLVSIFTSAARSNLSEFKDIQHSFDTRKDEEVA